jgi:hypothetical protein
VTPQSRQARHTLVAAKIHFGKMTVLKKGYENDFVVDKAIQQKESRMARWGQATLR